MRRNTILFWTCLLTTAAVGCGGGSAPPSTAPAGGAATAAPAAASSDVQPAAPAPRPEPERMELPTISLSASPAAASTVNSPAAITDPAEHRRDLLAAMMPLQIMLGQWHGTTQREVGDFKALDQPSWVWDFQTDKNQPAMVMTSAASPYIRQARLTYLTDRGIYRMTLTDADGNARTLEGKFIQPAVEFQGDDRKMHTKYKLELTQVAPETPRDQWQIVLNQQENNRYLLEMAKRRGSSYLRFDTVATQREGTSFAKSDDDYGERKCIISGGLGTIQVSYKGKSYWVCCTGCKAAFEDDPESWLAEYEKKKASGS